MSLSQKWSGNKAAYNFRNIPVSEHLKQTGQDHLPQAGLLTKSVEHLEDKMIEAYLRGSFSLGEADEHSDIDLFLVVEPEKLEDAYNAFIEFIEEDHEIVVACHDRLVADYGGIGFMFIIKDEQDRMFQFDFYMAMKGVAPKIHQNYWHRICSREPDYCWVEETHNNDLPEQTQKFIEKHTSNSSVIDELQYQMVDMMVALSIMKKHLLRGQYARGVKDNNHLIGICVEMLRAYEGDDSVHCSFYAADKLIQNLEGRDDMKHLATGLKHALSQPVSLEKVVQLYELGSDILKSCAPDLFEGNNQTLEQYDRLVIQPLRDYISRMDQAPRMAIAAP